MCNIFTDKLKYQTDKLNLSVGFRKKIKLFILNYQKFEHKETKNVNLTIFKPLSYINSLLPKVLF